MLIFLRTVLKDKVYPFVLIKDSYSNSSECGGKSPRQPFISSAALMMLTRERRAKRLPFFLLPR